MWTLQGLYMYTDKPEIVEEVVIRVSDPNQAYKDPNQTKYTGSQSDLYRIQSGIYRIPIRPIHVYTIPIRPSIQDPYQTYTGYN